ncbi:hypothetical protein BPT24_237 [Tenacibaculum phage pT24]|uniref:Uncharacterized protein n=1 Tax=Tenacibaculum phage pT24 TaxID=1880590 RepID=A0A1B4XX34_9CAUD|nr:hypothetical protein HYP10_gp291 [Tenacibaculum phage pT24]BAV39357.1 hypothetical protein BPT24_237 [Tenacibaculum phage pT24]
MSFYNTILEQLGGNKFLTMTGVTNLIKSDKDLYLSMKLRRNKSKAQYLKITLNANDTYTMEFSKFNKQFDKTVVSLHENVYCDMLTKIFEDVTGFYTKLF